MLPVWVDIRTPRHQGQLAGPIAGYGDLAIEVADLSRAQRFYTELLGFAPDGETADGPRLRVGPGQALILVERATPRTWPESVTHQTYRFPAAAHAAVVGHLEAAGVPL